MVDVLDDATVNIMKKFRKVMDNKTAERKRIKKAKTRDKQLRQLTVENIFEAPGKEKPFLEL